MVPQTAQQTAQYVPDYVPKGDMKKQSFGILFVDVLHNCWAVLYGKHKFGVDQQNFKTNTIYQTYQPMLVSQQNSFYQRLWMDFCLDYNA